jgi:hypothetical protein
MEKRHQPSSSAVALIDFHDLGAYGVCTCGHGNVHGCDSTQLKRDSLGGSVGGGERGGDREKGLRTFPLSMA